jgi:hypothetical protein
VNADKFARVLAGLAVLAVAIVAGIVSFSHIETLALANGYSVDTARLLPVSVDGLIVAASLALLTGVREHREAPRLARAGLVLGIVATLAANVEAGARFGAVGAIVNAWPGVAFIVASEILLGMLRGPQDVPLAEEATGTVADGVPQHVPASLPEIVPVDVSASTPYPVPARRSLTVAATRAHRRAPVGKSKAPELERGELPSLRAIKARMHVGTDRAREIQRHLSRNMQERPEAA